MRKFILIIMIFSCIFYTANAVADTGTYRILDYKVTLTPHSSGEVDIDYYQKWLVTSGDIPWITVGTPNSDFTIIREKSKGAIYNIGPANEGGWSGVKINLNRDYQPNETFEVWFSITQRGLFYANDTDYKLDFTPGWYDRAITDNLTIEMVCFAALDQIKASPEPTLKAVQRIIWEKENLPSGEHFTIGISFPKTLVAMDEKGLKTQEDNSGLVSLFAILFMAVVLIVIFGKLFWHDDEKQYSGGHYYGSSGIGRGGGRIGGVSSGRSSGGGGGFGGAGFSCACACAGCACACACAGGGGAGCSRKIDHTCPICSPKGKDI